ncbi:hypothetical protein [Dickeya poaceiphila]|uniref:hypothetical protein n=1 Tax=Dickeya poaceiphila TaxID=568768 RepID=UPI0012DA5270|nr:hypothetical protein [Dickeya poaceiphila]
MVYTTSFHRPAIVDAGDCMYGMSSEERTREYVRFTSGDEGTINCGGYAPLRNK